MCELLPSFWRRRQRTVLIIQCKSRKSLVNCRLAFDNPSQRRYFRALVYRSQSNWWDYRVQSLPGEMVLTTVTCSTKALNSIVDIESLMFREPSCIFMRCHM